MSGAAPEWMPPLEGGISPETWLKLVPTLAIVFEIRTLLAAQATLEARLAEIGSQLQADRRALEHSGDMVALTALDAALLGVEVELTP
jgi:hypothetical protein